MDTLSDYVLENTPGMQRCPYSLMCAVMLSVYPPVRLTFTHMPPTVRSVCDVWLPFLLNHCAIHWRVPTTRHLFSECEWITFQCCLTIKGVQVFKQIPFMLSESSVTPRSANMPLQRRMAFRGVGYMYLRACTFPSTSVRDIWGQDSLRIQWSLRVSLIRSRAE